MAVKYFWKGSLQSWLEGNDGHHKALVDMFGMPVHVGHETQIVETLQKALEMVLRDRFIPTEYYITDLRTSRPCVMTEPRILDEIRTGVIPFEDMKFSIMGAVRYLTSIVYPREDRSGFPDHIGNSGWHTVLTQVLFGTALGLDDTVPNKVNLAEAALNDAELKEVVQKAVSIANSSKLYHMPAYGIFWLQDSEGVAPVAREEQHGDA